eukprot:scaffold46528_cov72-Cyclotella_meneghiniana.AAC.11
MSPRRARSAYSLYFRFRKNMHKTPTFQIDFECNDANRERYKAFVQRVLIGVRDDEANETQKYIGNNNFSDMSKQIGNDWKKVDDLTRSIFKELAVADDRRYKKSYARNQWETQALPSQEIFENGTNTRSGTKRTLELSHSSIRMKNHGLPPSPQDAHLELSTLMNSNRSQAQAQQVQDPKAQSHGVTSHPRRYNSRVGTDAEEITETSNAMITNDDLLELLSFLIPVETC